MAATDPLAGDSRADASGGETTAPVISTLIEFPGAGRAARPQWRKQLSERVREIQERRAREAEEAARRPQEQPAAEPPAQQLGLVPPPDLPQINPLVAAALRRIERARQSYPPATRTRGGGGAATAVARVVEDDYQPVTTPATLEAQASMPLQKPDKALVEKSPEAAREHGLVVISTAQPLAARVEVAQTEVTTRHAAEAIDEAILDSTHAQEAEALPVIEPYDDRAPLHRRVVAAVIDLMVVAFASSPFSAIIELTNGNWADMRVAGSMGGIILVITFLYLTASTALSGRTWGMSLLSLRPVDAETGLPPTTRQAMARAILFMFSLATAGLGILYALYDAEGRAAHDHFSGTVVVRE
ncbi:MAG TPA: RDD family protein [Pyrinomonadaceae bacterium]|jgi:uncharacterized RDD family membrane protein YckC